MMVRFIDKHNNCEVIIFTSKEDDFEEYILVQEVGSNYTYWCTRDDLTELESDDDDGTYEYSVMHKNYPSEQHRFFGTSLALAEEWVREAEEEDGIFEGVFYVARRPIGHWEKF